MPQHLVKRGLDLPIAGAASGGPIDLPPPATVSYSPEELRGFLPKLEAREGATVRVGTPIAHDKTYPQIKLLSPVSGRIREIIRGERRVIQDIVFERAGDEAESFPTWTLERLAGISRADATAAICSGGLWPLLRARPLSRIARPDHTPQSILVSATESGPLMPGPDVLLQPGDKDALQAGLLALKALTDGPVFLAVRKGESHAALQGLKGVEAHEFSGPHPSGDAALQVNLVDPPRGGAEVWYLKAWDAVLIGRLLLQGRYPTERVYAVVGAGAPSPRVVRTIVGAPLEHLAGPGVAENVRWIRGSVLTGQRHERTRWASFTGRGLHLLPDEVSREFLGWTMPQLGRFSFHKAYLSGFLKPSRPVDMRPGVWGGHRSIVPIGVYEKVVSTPDIDIAFLFRSILAGDLEESIQLGLLDLTEEEAALCTYICPSKIEFDELLKSGLQAYQKEM
jgi:Na+-transporting NADH:ubiquinone oxidoreductase subunit A